MGEMIGKNGGVMRTWEKGESGNAGRKGYRRFDLVIRQVLSTSVWVPDPDQISLPPKQRKKVAVSVQEAIIMAIASRALQGDVQAAAYLSDRMEGKPTMKAEISTNVQHNLRYENLADLRSKMAAAKMELAIYDDGDGSAE